jgi:hypothetical protein
VDGELLKRCGPYVDMISLHTYPYWSNDSEYNLMLKTNAVAEYMPKLKKAIAEYCQAATSRSRSPSGTAATRTR